MELTFQPKSWDLFFSLAPVGKEACKLVDEKRRQSIRQPGNCNLKFLKILNNEDYVIEMLVISNIPLVISNEVKSSPRRWDVYV